MELGCAISAAAVGGPKPSLAVGSLRLKLLLCVIEGIIPTDLENLLAELFSSGAEPLMLSKFPL